MAWRALSLKLRYGFSLLCIVPPGWVLIAQRISVLLFLRGRMPRRNRIREVEQKNFLDLADPADRGRIHRFKKQSESFDCLQLIREDNPHWLNDTASPSSACAVEASWVYLIRSSPISCTVVLLPVNTLQLKRYPGIYSHAAKENRKGEIKRYGRNKTILEN